MHSYRFVVIGYIFQALFVRTDSLKEYHTGVMLVRIFRDKPHDLFDTGWRKKKDLEDCSPQGLNMSYYYFYLIKAN
ncbi:hypothetical protein B5G50_19400 [Brevibacillus brevis]|nr:hypothetical protein B5G50_19400 [Brevibacillus brevis]